MATTSEPAPPLDRARLRSLGDEVPGLRVEVLAQVSSTNALLGDRARDGEGAGLVVVAEHQTAGRGRLDRVWQAPAGAALTFSMLLRPAAPARQWPWLPLLSGCAVARTLAAVGFDAKVKWPNDVLLTGDARTGERRKVAGILVERIETATGAAAIVGIGLNVTMSLEELPVAGATSLALAAGHGPIPERTDLLVALLTGLDRTFAEWASGGAAAARLRASYGEVCVSVGQRVRVELPSGEQLIGDAIDIDQGGRLLVEHAGGRTAVSAGDVVHVRPADA